MEMNVAYPGLCIEYSVDAGASWIQYTDPVEVKEEKDILLQTKYGLNYSLFNISNLIFIVQRWVSIFTYDYEM